MSVCQSVKVLTYLEPQNPEYLQFVETLKDDAKKMFNFTIQDSLVPNTDCISLFCQGVRELVTGRLSLNTRSSTGSPQRYTVYVNLGD